MTRQAHTVGDVVNCDEVETTVVDNDGVVGYTTVGGRVCVTGPIEVVPSAVVTVVTLDVTFS